MHVATTSIQPLQTQTLAVLLIPAATLGVRATLGARRAACLQLPQLLQHIVYLQPP